METDLSKSDGGQPAFPGAGGSAPWTATKYPDCKTWTVFGEGRTIASRMTETDARRIATLPTLTDLLEQVLVAAENADETGYVTDLGFVDLDALHAKARAAIAAAREPNKEVSERLPAPHASIASQSERR